MKKLVRYYLLLILLSGSGFSFAQNKLADSLKIALKNAEQDTTKLKLRNDIGEAASIFRIGYWESLYVDAANVRYRKIEAAALNNVGYIYCNQGSIPNALDNFERGLKIFNELSDKKGAANALNNIGTIYDHQGDIPKALDYYSRSLKMQTEIGDKAGIANSLNNIGLLYYYQGDTLNAMNSYKKSLIIQREIGNKAGIASLYSNMALIYTKRNDYKTSLDLYIKSLKLRQEIGDRDGIAKIYNNLGACYYYQHDMSSALDYYKKSLEIQRILGNKMSAEDALLNIAGVYIVLKKYPIAHLYADSAVTSSRELGFPINISNSEHRLSQVDSAIGNYSEAFYHYKQYIIFKDSISNEKNRKASLRNQLKYEFEKKEAVLKEQQEKERVITENKNRFQQIVIWIILFGLLLVIIFAVFVLRTLKTTRFQKVIIEEKQKEILASIHYAKRIQSSLLPTEKYIASSLKRLRENK
jgi:tetratricopeptide (TPR) repeat protein